MKVLIYSKWFFPVPGGVQTVVRDLANGLSAWQSGDKGGDHIQVTVVTRTAPASGEEDSYPFEVVRRPGLFKFARLMREADVVHLAGPAFLPMVLGLALRKPVVIEHHGFQTACPNGLLFFEPTQSPCSGHFMAGRYGKCLECNAAVAGRGKSIFWLATTPLRRWLSNRARANVMPTEWLGSILKLNHMVTIPHGVAEHGSAKAAMSSTTFAFQGRLVTSKGVQVLLSAAKCLSDEGRRFRVKIIGDGPESAALQSGAADLDGQVKFLGHVPDEELEEALSDVGAIIMPSLGGEVFGLVAAENMARGKWVIVSDIGALKEVVGDAGFVFPVGDAAALASCMRRVLENPSLACSLGAASRTRATKLFGATRMVEEHAALYREILNGRGGRPHPSADSHEPV